MLDPFCFRHLGAQQINMCRGDLVPKVTDNICDTTVFVVWNPGLAEKLLIFGSFLKSTPRRQCCLHGGHKMNTEETRSHQHYVGHQELRTSALMKKPKVKQE